MRPLFILKCIIFFVAFFPFANFVKGQDTSVYFFRSSFRGTIPVHNADSADFIRLISPSLSEKLVNVSEYFRNGKLKFEAKGIASTFKKSNGFVKYEGNAIDFFPTGKRRVIAFFKNGERFGQEYFYYPEGKLFLVMNHKVNTRTGLGNPFIVDCYDSEGNQICKDGFGKAIEYDIDFKEILRGPVEGGLRNGEWNGTFFGRDTIKYKFFYKKEELISGIGYDKLGHGHIFKKTFELAAPEGILLDYITRLKRNIKLSKSSHISKAVIDSTFVTFDLDTAGHITKVATIKPVPDELLEALKGALEKSGKWNPGELYGLPFENRVVISLNIVSNYSQGWKQFGYKIIPLYDGKPWEMEFFDATKKRIIGW